MLLFIFFVSGLIIGSFLNVVINRLHLEKSLDGRSYCPNCKATLEAQDLVPVLSFVFLQGKCRHCGKSISWQYPAVELATTISFLLLATRYELSLSLVLACALAAFYVVIATYDLKHFLILDKVVYPGIAVAAVFAIVQGHIISGLIGAAIISGFFYFQYYISKGRWIGFGDVKLGIMLGLAAGFPIAILLMFAAYMLGAITGVIMIALGKKQLGSQLPFGTFLAIAAVFTLLYGQAVMNWYSKLIGLSI